MRIVLLAFLITTCALRTSAQELTKINLVPIGNVLGITVTIGPQQGNIFISTLSAYSSLPLSFLQEIGAEFTKRIPTRSPVGGTTELEFYMVMFVRIGDCILQDVTFLATTDLSPPTLGWNFIERVGLLGIDSKQRLLYFECPLDS